MSDQEPSRVKNLAYAAIAGQSGCMALFVIVIALVAGLWLDAQFGLRGPFVVGLLLMSIPVSLFFMVRLALGSVKNIPPPQPTKNKRLSSSTEED
ncbi:MAG: hypothetical protein KME04_10220 [Pleurocapsa minor GSE-CHR-MK-17-07R]|jgi:hypothetical protein|nr:hypothetical protein [Pleurocapsa minor GSE-CHR-MK 17-07R]